MVTDLIQQLRKCPADERKHIANELARLGSDEAISELIRMAKGMRRSWFKRYDTDAQLIALELLGETESRTALSFLQEAISLTKILELGRFEGLCVDWTTYEITFPKTSGTRLYRLLRTRYDIDGFFGENNGEKALKENETYQKIVSSIQKLEAMIKSNL